MQYNRYMAGLDTTGTGQWLHEQLGISIFGVRAVISFVAGKIVRRRSVEHKLKPPLPLGGIGHQLGFAELTFLKALQI